MNSPKCSRALEKSRPSRRDNIKIGFKGMEYEGVNLINLAFKSEPVFKGGVVASRL